MQKLLDDMETSSNAAYSYKSVVDKISSEELSRLGNSGIKVKARDLNKYLLEDDTFEYKGQKVIIYIKDQWGDKTYKYHISNCKTLIQMKNSGRFERYVISNRTDGVFQVNVLSVFYRQAIQKNIEIPMNVCMNCISTMQLHYPSNLDLFNYHNFDLQKFLKNFNSKIKILPKYTNQTVPNNDYPENWKEISRSYREYRKWKCEKCYKDFKDNRSMLHCHHIGPKYDNAWDKLKALCKECHQLEPGHSHMK